VFPAAGPAFDDEVVGTPTATGTSAAEETATAAAENLVGESVLALGTEAAVDVQFRKIRYNRKEAVWYARGFEALRCIPLTGDWRWGEALRDEHIVISHLPKQDIVKAGKALHRAIRVIRFYLDSGAPFVKIGITGNPFNRWTYYSREGEQDGKWSHLVLLAVYHDRDAVSVMEASLIRDFSCDVRCKNRAPGGEVAENMGGPPFCTYLAIGERGPQQ
jgi:hypothetical protein